VAPVVLEKRACLWRSAEAVAASWAGRPAQRARWPLLRASGRTSRPTSRSMVRDVESFPILRARSIPMPSRRRDSTSQRYCCCSPAGRTRAPAGPPGGRELHLRSATAAAAARETARVSAAARAAGTKRNCQPAPGT
jgi:hypothetical protein